jgi:hypothetical protein
MTFCSLVQLLHADDIDEKIYRYFKMLEQEGRVNLSYSELIDLCRHSFISLRDIDPESKNGFFEKLSHYLAKFIFEKARVKETERI